MYMYCFLFDTYPKHSHVPICKAMLFWIGPLRFENANLPVNTAKENTKKSFEVKFLYKSSLLLQRNRRFLRDCAVPSNFLLLVSSAHFDKSFVTLVQIYFRAPSLILIIFSKRVRLNLMKISEVVWHEQRTFSLEAHCIVTNTIHSCK